MAEITSSIQICQVNLIIWTCSRKMIFLTHDKLAMFLICVGFTQPLQPKGQAYDQLSQ